MLVKYVLRMGARGNPADGGVITLMRKSTTFI
jgi:hypothetical protein